MGGGGPQHASCSDWLARFLRFSPERPEQKGKQKSLKQENNLSPWRQSELPQARRYCRLPPGCQARSEPGRSKPRTATQHWLLPSLHLEHEAADPSPAAPTLHSASQRLRPLTSRAPTVPASWAAGYRQFGHPFPCPSRRGRPRAGLVGTGQGRLEKFARRRSVA